MTTASDTDAKQNPYMLAHRQGNIEEDRRLDAQHEVIKEGIIEGHLIVPAIPLEEIKGAVADIGCGTGVWLNDIARTYFLDRLESDPPLLIGWDIDPSRFTKNPEPGVQLHQHDCTEPFPESFHSAFDLVSIRALAYAVPEQKFLNLVEHAVQLLRPGGYLLWMDSEMSNVSSITPSSEIERAIKIIGEERRARKLVPYLLRMKNPHFDPDSADSPPTPELVTITHFRHYVSGPVHANKSVSAEMNDEASRIVLEALKLLVMAASARKKSLMKDEQDKKRKEALERDVEENAGLEAFITTALADGSVKLTGNFPCVVARKW